MKDGATTVYSANEVSLWIVERIVSCSYSAFEPLVLLIFCGRPPC
jgi:hypothetical protein